MKKKLTHVNAVHVGKVVGALGALYSVFVSLCFIVIVGVGMVVSSGIHSTTTGHLFGWQFAGLDTIVMLLLIPVIGFIYGFIGAVLFNFIARCTGGIEFTLSDVAPREVPPWPAALPRYPFAPR